jgi:hypothetical protein
MFKKSLATVLSLAILSLSVSTVSAASDTEKQAEFEAKVKQAVFKLGTGSAARLEVTLRDKTKVKGYVSEASADTFVVMNVKTSTSQTIAYAQVKGVKGQNLSTGAKVAIGVGIVVGVIAVIWVIWGDRINSY